MLKLVVDTNVIVSAFLKSKSTSDLIMSLVLQGDYRICLSDEIFTEYKEVLSREKFKRLNKTGIGAFFSKLSKQALWVVPENSVDGCVKDEDDKMFLECAFAAKADFIITGNKKHFHVEKFKSSKIVTPREFLDKTILN